MYTLLARRSYNDPQITIKGFKTQDEAYNFYLTYFDNSYNIEIVKETE